MLGRFVLTMWSGERSELLHRRTLTDSATDDPAGRKGESHGQPTDHHDEGSDPKLQLIMGWPNSWRVECRDETVPANLRVHAHQGSQNRQVVILLRQHQQ